MVSGVNFLTAILLARYLGIEEFGRFTLAWMAVLFANSIQYAMIIAPMMSTGPKQSAAERPAYYGAVVAQQIVVSVFFFFAVFSGVRLSAVFFPEWRVEGFALPLAAAAVALLSQDFLRRYFFTCRREAVAFANDAIRYLGQIAVLIWLFLSYPESMDSIKTLWVIAVLATAAAVYGAFYVERVEINAATVRRVASRHWHFSKWLVGSAILQWCSGNLFTVASGAVLGSSAVGALKAVHSLMGVTHVLILGLDNIVPVRAARNFHVGGKPALYSYLRRVTFLGGAATGVIAVIAAVVPDFWLGLVFGEQYSGYGYLLQWFAVVYCFSFFGLPLRAGLRAIEHTRTIFWAYLWMALFSVIFAYPFVVHFELAGAAAGFIIAYLVSIAVHTHGLRKYTL